MRFHATTVRASVAVMTLCLTLAACNTGGTSSAQPADDGEVQQDGDTAGNEGGGELSGEIRIDGSSTVAPFTEVAAELFMQEHPGVNVTVGVSGTGGGFERFCNGETDMSDASRPIAEDEAAACEEAGIEYEEISVALDGLVNVVNPAADWVDCLTVEELNAIWAPDSEISNWSEVRDGFPDVPMELFGAGTDSGTFDYYTEAINGEEGAIRTDYNATEDDNVTVQGVSGTDGGLGFFGLSYLEENADVLKGLAVDGGDGCVEASVDTVQSGDYTPLSRPLFVYPSAQALERPEVQAFLRFMLDNDAEIAETAQFVPLTDEQLAEARAQVDSLMGG